MQELCEQRGPLRGTHGSRDEPVVKVVFGRKPMRSALLTVCVAVVLVSGLPVQDAVADEEQGLG